MSFTSAITLSGSTVNVSVDGFATETTLQGRLAESTFTARVPTPGQKIAASSVPVVVSSDQIVPVSSTALVTVTGSVNVTNQVFPVTGNVQIVAAQQIPVVASQDSTWTVDISSSSGSFARDAFGRSRISLSETLFDSKLIYNDDPLVWSDRVTGQGAVQWNPSRASVSLNVSASQVVEVIRRTKAATNYQPGKSLLCMQSFIPGTPAAGIIREFGRYDASNGLFLQLSGSSVNFVKRSDTSGSPVDTVVSQSSWNIDRMDGTGLSRKTIDWTKSQLMWHDIEWLGVGATRMGFSIDGEFYIAHIFKHTNIEDKVYMRTPNLPIRYRIANDGTGASTSLEIVCSTVISEGGNANSLGSTGIVLGASNVNNSLAASSLGVNYMAMALRLGPTTLSASINLEQIETVDVNQNDAYEWALVINPTIAGSFNWVTPASGSVVQVASGSTTNTMTGGTVQQAGIAWSRVPISLVPSTALRLGATIDGTPDVIALRIKPLVGTSQTHYASLTWREFK